MRHGEIRRVVRLAAVAVLGVGLVVVVLVGLLAVLSGSAALLL